MTSYWHRLRALSPNAKRFLVGTVFRSTYMGIWMLLFNLYLISMGFDAAFIGLLNTLLSAASTLCSLPAGLIADRIGRKRAMIIGLVGMTLSGAGVLSSSQGWQIAASHALFGIIGPLFYTSGPPFLMENSTPKERAMLFTVEGSLMQLALFVATTVGGYLPGVFASALNVGHESPMAYRGALVVAVIAIGLTLVPVLTFRDTAKPASPRPTTRFWRNLPNSRLLAKLLMPRVINAFGAGLLFPFLNLFYKQRFGLSDAALGWIFGLTNIVAAAIMLWGGALAERWGKIRATLVARTLSLPMMLVIGFVPSLPVVAVVHWIRKGLMLLGGPLYMAFAMEQFDDEERATGSSLLTMGWDVGWALGPSVSGVVQVHAGFGPLFVATTAFYGLSLLLTYRFFGRREAKKVQSLGRDEPFGADASS